MAACDNATNSVKPVVDDGFKGLRPASERTNLKRNNGLAVRRHGPRYHQWVPGRWAPMRPAGAVVPYAQAEAEFEKLTLEHALRAADGQISEAAKLLRISRATFYKKLAKFGLTPSD